MKAITVRPPLTTNRCATLALVPLYLAASVRVGVVGGSISELSPLPKHISRTNPCAIVASRMCVWDHSHVPQMGEFTAQPSSARVLTFIEVNNMRTSS